MKKLTLLCLGLAALLLITSAAPNSNQSKRNFEKIVFLELTVEQDSMLFKPYSKAWDQYWGYSSDIFMYETQLMNYEKYTAAFTDRKDNLWTIFHPLIIESDIQVYNPYDPELFGFGGWDEGELRFPIYNEKQNETFLGAENIRERVCNLIGNVGPQSDIPLTDEYGDPLIVTAEDGMQYYRYPPRDYYWFTDQDIVKYKLRVRIELNKDGKEKKRVIEAIAPVRHRTFEGEERVEDVDVLWFKFDDLKSILKENYFLDTDWKPISYLKHIEEKVKNADFRGSSE